MITSLLEQLQSEAALMMLFLKSVHTIEVSGLVAMVKPASGGVSHTVVAVFLNHCHHLWWSWLHVKSSVRQSNACTIS